MSTNRDIKLSAVDLSMQFGGQVALNDVSCEFTTRCVTAIIGPNGAGKTTLFNLFSGQLAPTEGKIFLGGQDITKKTAAQRANLGIGRAFQRTNLFPGLSVFENVCVAVQSRLNISHKFWALSSKQHEVTDQAELYLARVDLLQQKDLLATNLSHGGKRRLEVGMLMALEPSVYMFDEPTTGMSMEEVPEILELIASIRANTDKIVVLVEHKMDVVRNLAERVIVLHNGRLLADGDFEHVMNSPQVQRAYLGVSPDAGMKFVS
ncbi:MAG: ABC transporter ATP-binding protein [Agarilytica sp.]